MSSYYTSSSSSTTDSSDVEERLKDLRVNEEKEINILLLGETGVGKSTFINAMANYISLKFFSNAENKGLVKVIPTIYKVKDKNGKEHEIKIGPKNDQNECLKTGESATQNVKTYVFPISSGHANIRLIDTPGVGDTRGIEQDEKNCENIVNYIRKLEKLHAICFLCKPTHARKTVYFDYCIYQILAHLETQAVKNIFFLFTNTRGSNYDCGDSLFVLKKIVENVEKNSGVKIPLHQNQNIYCFENEGFRFLGASEKKVQFDNAVRERNLESWKRSAVQCWKFIKHLQINIEPYVPTKLLEVNFARNTLFQFSHVMAEISQLTADNQCVLDRLQDKITKELESISQLKDEKIKITNVTYSQMCQPILVCTSVPSCAEVYKINGLDKWHYKKICHSCSELSDVRYFVAGCPEIVNCHSIDSSNRKCNQCGCDFLLHMHVDYITSLQEQLIEPEDLSQRLATRESALNEYTEITDDIKVTNVQFQSEYDIIKKLCVNLSRYLKDHAIVAFSDSYKEYIQYLINQKQSSDNTSSVKNSLENLKKISQRYVEAELAFQQALKSPLVSREDLNFNMKDEQFQHLFTLKENGKKKKKAERERDYRKSNNEGYSRGKGRGTGGNQQHRGSRQDGPPNYPERPVSRNSTSSYHSTWSGGKNRGGNQHDRPASRNFRDYQRPPDHSQSSRTHPPNMYSSQESLPKHKHPDPQYSSKSSSYRGREKLNINVTVEGDNPRRSHYTQNYHHSYGQHHSSQHYDQSPPPHYYGQQPPPTGDNAPPPTYGPYAPPPTYGPYAPPPSYVHPAPPPSYVHPAPPPNFGHHAPPPPNYANESRGRREGNFRGDHQNTKKGDHQNTNKTGNYNKNRGGGRNNKSIFRNRSERDHKSINKNKRDQSSDSDSSS